MKTPGVYLVEENDFPVSVVEVATAVPAFIGYTEKAMKGSASLLNKPFRISSMAEFRTYFGGAPVSPSALPPKEDGVSFSLYFQMMMFFLNGGGPCYIVSIGDYTVGELSADAFKKGIGVLVEEQEPTLVLCPEAVGLKDKELCFEVQAEILAHCGKMGSRIAMLDIYDGYKSRNDAEGDVVTEFREKIGCSHLDLGVAYYPWLNVSVTETGGAKCFSGLLPPSAAMAGIYTMVDNSRGLWKAPANVGVNSVVSPAVNLTSGEQEDLNVTANGKSVNVIRWFPGEGVRVWGARTLDGNSQDWRYVNTRRTMIMLEESVRNAVRAYVFEPNVAATWLTIKNTIGNFLCGIWKRGGLMGATPEDAYSVHVGLGDTMTGDDILNGTLRVTVLVALIRPAEFLTFSFQQQMQKN